jgi:hypothetical protein
MILLYCNQSGKAYSAALCTGETGTRDVHSDTCGSHSNEYPHYNLLRRDTVQSGSHHTLRYITTGDTSYTLTLEIELSEDTRIQLQETHLFDRE